LDLMLTKGKTEKCFVEVKNCTLVKDGIAYFPDAVTTRGRKHLVELQRLAKEGNRSIIFFLVQRMDAKAFSSADKIDPAYAKELRKAKNSGVEIIVYDVLIDLKKIVLGKKIPQIDI
ncbi:MAG: DNA/RNA nuclease SfsA, partial [Desulfobacteraceae bacterium]